MSNVYSTVCNDNNVCTSVNNHVTRKEERPDCKGHLNCLIKPPRNEVTIFRDHVVNVTSGGRIHEAIMDTGANISVISSLIVQDRHSNAVTYPSPVQLCVLADGDAIPVLGETLLMCQLGSETYRLRFIVIDNKDTSQMILGCDFLRAVDATINFKQSKLTIDSNTSDTYESISENTLRGNERCSTSRANTVWSGYICEYMTQNPRSYKDVLLTNLPRAQPIDAQSRQTSPISKPVISSESWSALDQPLVVDRGFTFATMKLPPRTERVQNTNMQLNNKGDVIATATAITPEYYVHRTSHVYNKGNTRAYAGNKPTYGTRQSNTRMLGPQNAPMHRPHIATIATARAATPSRAPTIRKRNGNDRQSSYYSMNLPSYRTEDMTSATPNVDPAVSMDALQQTHNATAPETYEQMAITDTLNTDTHVDSAATRVTIARPRSPKPYISWAKQDKPETVELSPTTGFPKRDPPDYSQIVFKRPPSSITHSHVPKMCMQADSTNYHSQLAEQEAILRNVQYSKEFNPTIPNTPVKYLYFFTKDDYMSNFYTRKQGPLFNGPAFIDGELRGHDFMNTEVAYHHIKALYASRPDIAAQVLTLAPSKAKALTQKRNMPELSIPAWHLAAPTIMNIIVRHKFKQNPDLKQKLMDTAGHFLVEASPSDRFWGCALNKERAEASAPTHPSRWGTDIGRASLNILGNLLTRLRETFRSEEGQPPSVDVSLLRHHTIDNLSMKEIVFPGMEDDETPPDQYKTQKARPKQKSNKERKRAQPQSPVTVQTWANYKTQAPGHNALNQVTLIESKRIAINEYVNTMSPLNFGKMKLSAVHMHLTKYNFTEYMGDVFLLPGNSLGRFGGPLKYMLDSVFDRDMDEYIHSYLGGRQDHINLPLGSAILIPVPHKMGKLKYFVYSPSMLKPAMNVSKTNNAFICMNACLEEITQYNITNPHSPLRQLSTTLIGTGIGKMPYETSSKQLARALLLYVRLHNPKSLNEHALLPQTREDSRKANRFSQNSSNLLNNTTEDKCLQRKINSAPKTHRNAQSQDSRNWDTHELHKHTDRPQNRHQANNFGPETPQSENIQQQINSDNTSQPMHKSDLSPYHNTVTSARSRQLHRLNEHSGVHSSKGEGNRPEYDLQRMNVTDSKCIQYSVPTQNKYSVLAEQGS